MINEEVEVQEKQRKSRFIGFRINQDTLLILDAFKEAKQLTYSETIRLAIKQYFDNVIAQEEELSKKNVDKQQ